MFLRRGLGLAMTGLVSGVLIATVVTRLMRSLLFGVSPIDPLTYALVASFVLAVVTCAAYIPARRSTRAGCIEALRAE
jgi:ABC-type antimicrobial peptide transport system permease subunit